MSNPGELEKKLIRGEERARVIALKVIQRVRGKLGFG
jgi:hypothetical protein